MTSKFFKLAATLLVAALVCIGTSFAQEATQKPASLAFDINGQAIMQSKIVKMIPMPPGGLGPRLEILQAKRFFGAVSLPESIEAVGQFMPGSPVPVEFIAIAEFDSKETREAVIPTAALASASTTTINGKEYYVEPNVENIHLLLEEKKFEVGTKQYLTVQRSALLTSNLKSAMSELGKAPLKIVLDLTQDRQFFLDTIDTIKKQGVPPTVGPFLELPKKMDQLLVSIDPDADEMVKLVSKSSKADDAAYVAKTLNALVGLGKMGIQSGPKNNPEVEFATMLINAVSVKADGNNAVLILKKPASFDKMMASMMEQAKQQAAQMTRSNNLRQLLLSMHNYESAYRVVPFNHSVEGRLSEDLSWRVRVLPFIEQNALYEKFDLSEPWDSEKNKPLANTMPEIFGKDGKTNMCWIVSDVKGFQDITDGLSNTICMIESKNLVPWTEAKDITADEAEKMITGLADGEKILVGLYDGSVRYLDNQTPPEAVRAMLTPAGGEVVNF
ncbi:MAG: DUF1559 domain-containing protein [Pirellulales bacterium]